MRPGDNGRYLVGATLALMAWAFPQALPRPLIPSGSVVTILTEAIPLNPRDPRQTQLGDLTYTGGLALTSQQTSRLHGLSDLEVSSDGRLVAVGDEGDVLQARLVLDPHGRLSGLADARVSRLTAPDGRPLEAKEESDAEGLAFLPNGDMLISFERQHRIWRYPADGGPPTNAPIPAVRLPDNGGVEGIAADPVRGPSAYIASDEEGGRTWRCDLRTSCTPGPRVTKRAAFGVVAVRQLPEGRTVWLLRSFSLVSGNTVVLRIVDTGGRTIDEQRLQRPLTVDNFEGVSVVPGPAGTVRFYLLSDDNFSSTQRTLLLAFDWKAR